MYNVTEIMGPNLAHSPLFDVNNMTCSSTGRIYVNTYY